MSKAPTDPDAANAHPEPPRVLCAYSPRWLSGPLPGYDGLCATWSPDDDDASSVNPDHADH